MNDLALIEASRLTRPRTRWERFMHHYDLLLYAGLPDAEAESIAEEIVKAEFGERKTA